MFIVLKLVFVLIMRRYCVSHHGTSICTRLKSIGCAIFVIITCLNNVLSTIQFLTYVEVFLRCMSVFSCKLSLRFFRSPLIVMLICFLLYIPFLTIVKDAILCNGDMVNRNLLASEDDNKEDTMDDHYIKSRWSVPVFSWFHTIREMGIKFRGLPPPDYKFMRSPPRTSGHPFPKPRVYRPKGPFVVLNISHFDIKVIGKTCDVLDLAINRYKEFIFSYAIERHQDSMDHVIRKVTNMESEILGDSQYDIRGEIRWLELLVETPCTEYPYENMNETYKLSKTSSDTYRLEAREVWGALRGLESFSQLIHTRKRKHFIRSEVTIVDWPRFSHRGLLLDSARHFIEMDVILSIIDGLEQNKMNVFHWHLSDDQSFPYESLTFPELSSKGAYHQSQIYTQRNVADVIEYARLRGVRVIPEFDIPAHTYSWGLSHPELLTQCFLKMPLELDPQTNEYVYTNVAPQGFYGAMDPSKNSTFDFLEAFFTEITGVFKDQYIHIGFDEVLTQCWDSNQDVRDLRTEILSHRAKTNKDKESVETRGVTLQYFLERFLERLEKVSESKKKVLKLVMWEDSVDSIQIPRGVIIQTWKGGETRIKNALEKGHQVIHSWCWYLNLIDRQVDWQKMYECDPVGRDFRGDTSGILGGEAAMWTEYFTNENVLSTIWPRACAVAERLWSDKSLKLSLGLAQRLYEQRCRMLARSLRVGHLNGPDYCPPPLKRRDLSHRLVTDSSGRNNTKEKIFEFPAISHEHLGDDYLSKFTSKLYVKIEGPLLGFIGLIVLGICLCVLLTRSRGRRGRFRRIRLC